MMAKLDGRTLGKYRIVELIGAGGMGEVYRAHDSVLDRDVAIKVLPEELARDNDRLRRFEREARAVARLAHPNILEIWDFGSDGDVVYAVMELLQGANLRHLIPEDGMSRQRVVEIGAAVAEGLAAAHAKGVVHRDLKPENVFVTSDGRVKILDFGLARIVESASPGNQNHSTSPTVSVAGAVVGTVGYMSPEQIRGELVDARSDIFSLGCMLYEMVAGRSPFARDTPQDSMAAILKDEPQRIAELHPGMAPDLDGLVARCLEKEPAARFQSAADLAFAFRSMGATGGHHAANAGGAIWKSRPWRFGAAALGGAILVAAGVMLIDQPGHEEAVPSPGVIDSIAVLPLQNLSGESGHEYFAAGMTEALIADLARIKALRVISRQSVARFENSDTPVPEIAAALGVDAVIQGSVLRVGDTVRITTQLIQADPEEHLWAESYERELQDILGLQREVARQIARAINIAVTAQEERLLATAPKVDPRAHELYLRGRHLVGTNEGFAEAPGLFRQAIAIDPDFAAPHAALAEEEVYSLPSNEHMPLARAHALKALEIDETLAEGHAILGLVRFYFDWDWQGAEDAFLKAIALEPASATAHHRYAFFLSAMGRQDEARAELRVAQELDPLNSSISIDHARTYYRERRYERAIEGFNQVLATEPDAYWALFFRGFAYEQLERYDEAAASLIEARRAIGQDQMADDLEEGFSEGGYPGLLRALLRYFSNFERGQPTSLAMIHARLGDKEAALGWLEKGYEMRTRSMVNLNVEPQFDSLREDPRFADLVRRVGLPNGEPQQR
jgi:TolB-like protein/tRNA A-37 threonylcarbamoyl transferase component Bud32